MTMALRDPLLLQVEKLNESTTAMSHYWKGIVCSKVLWRVTHWSDCYYKRICFSCSPLLCFINQGCLVFLWDSDSGPKIRLRLWL